MALDERITIGLAAGVAFIGLFTIGFIGVCIWAARRRRRVRALKVEAADTNSRMADLEIGDNNAAPLSKGSSTTSTGTAHLMAARDASQSTTMPEPHAQASQKQQKETHAVHETASPSRDQVDNGC